MENRDINNYYLRAPLVVMLKRMWGSNTGLVRLSKSKEKGWEWVKEGEKGRAFKAMCGRRGVKTIVENKKISRLLATKIKKKSVEWLNK